MKNKILLLPSILLALTLGAVTNDNTNSPVKTPIHVPIPSPSPRLDAPEHSQMPSVVRERTTEVKPVDRIGLEQDLTPGGTNKPSKLQSSPETIYSNTNAVLALPYVQQAMQQAFHQGVQFGVVASVQNKTLVQMEDANALQRAAMFLRFGNQQQQQPQQGNRP